MRKMRKMRKMFKVNEFTMEMFEMEMSEMSGCTPRPLKDLIPQFNQKSITLQKVASSLLSQSL